MLSTVKVLLADDRQSPGAFLECKSTGDGGTAHDNASRFANLRVEADCLGGVAVMAVLDGLRWRRLPDALGPGVRETDGLTFSAANLTDMLRLEPVASLVGSGPSPIPTP